MKFAFAIIFACVLVTSFYLVSLIKPYCVSRYGIDPIVVFILFLSAEAVFDLTLFAMAYWSGLINFGWRFIVNKKRLYKLLNWRNPVVLVSWIVNRVVWVIPFLYILWVGWLVLPLVITVAIIIEIVLTFILGFMVLKPIWTGWRGA